MFLVAALAAVQSCELSADGGLREDRSVYQPIYLAINWRQKHAPMEVSGETGQGSHTVC